MKKSVWIFCVLSVFLSGCATAPKPRSVGQTVGSAIDSTIVWASNGIQSLLNR